MESSIEQTEVLAALYRMKDQLITLDESVTKSIDLNQRWRDTLHGIHTRIQTSGSAQSALSFWWLGGYNDSTRLHLGLLSRIQERALEEMVTWIREVESV